MPAVTKTREQMIAELTGGQLAAAPPTGVTKTRAQMIADLTGQQSSGNEFLDAHPTLNTMVQGALSDLPTAGGVVGGAAGVGLGAAGGLATGGVASPILALAGGVTGAGAGGAAGSGLKDALTAMIYGKQKPLMDSVRDAASSGKDQAEYALLGEGIAQGTGIAAKAALATETGSKVGALLSGVPAQVVKAYADGAERIKAAFKGADENTFRMAQAAKQQYVQDIISTRGSLNNAISAGIKDSTAKIDAEPIIANLQEQATKLNPKLDADQISQINSLVDRTKLLTNGEGEIPVQAAQQLKLHFQGVADGVYQQGAESTAATPAQNAAKFAAQKVRSAMEPVLPSSVVKANRQLSTLHSIEDNMTKALLNPRKSAASLIGAGTGESAAGAKNLADLQDIQGITGTNMVQPAQDVAAAQSLGKYKFSPSLKGLGQPLVKGAVDLSAGTGQVGQTLGQTLGPAVMHGADAMNSLQQPGTPSP